MKKLSWSELYLWRKNRDEYIKRYVEGVQQESTPQMILGTIIHRTIENEQHPWMKELIDNNIHDKIGVVRTLLDKMTDKRPSESEVVMTTKEFPELLSVFDGLDRKNRILYEYKTSDKAERWNQRIVDTHLQLSFYAYVYKLNWFKYFREIRLYHLNTNTGSITTYETARGYQDIKQIKEIINQTVDEMREEGLWEKRLTKEKVIKARNLALV